MNNDPRSIILFPSGIGRTLSASGKVYIDIKEVINYHCGSLNSRFSELEFIIAFDSMIGSGDIKIYEPTADDKYMERDNHRYYYTNQQQDILNP
ncbi:MAG: hypothetical protein IKG82_13780 [Oscillospiraceae bacterium]|nr:hypothetical protein [Oscillospiraceae bacterium]MBR3419753.1 hypothetical protein [Oscillospiraceae bacterium]